MDPLKGPRLSCMICEDYNLCEGCYQQRTYLHPPTHKFCAMKAVKKKGGKKSAPTNPGSSSSKAETHAMQLPNLAEDTDAGDLSAGIEDDASSEALKHVDNPQDSDHASPAMTRVWQPHLLSHHQAESTHQGCIRSSWELVRNGSLSEKADDKALKSLKVYKIPSKSLCGCCGRGVRSNKDGIACWRWRETGSIGCKCCICWTCMEKGPNSILGRVRIARRDFDRLGHDAWWMHEKCMSSTDVIDYSAMMMPPPSEPEAAPEAEAPPEDIPDGWQAKLSKSTGKWYYVHLKTQQAQWSPPPQPSSSSTSCPHPTEEARMQ